MKLFNIAVYGIVKKFADYFILFCFPYDFNFS